MPGRRTTVEQPRVPEGLTRLEGAELEDETVWQGALLTGPVTVGAVAGHVEIDASRAQGLRLTGCELDHLRVTDTVLEDCELSGAVLSHATLLRVELRRCRMSGLVAPGLKANDVRLVECKVDQANFRTSSWERCEIADCEMAGADFYSARLTTTRLARCNLTGIQVSKARFDRVSLHGSVVESILGADALRGVVIGTDQVMALAPSVFAALGIAVEDDQEASP